MRKLELALCALLALAGLGHAAGTFAGYPIGSETFVWSLSTTAFVFTIVFLHWLRIRRPQDGQVAAGAIVTTAVWIGLALMFGASIGAVGDPRVLIHVAVSAALLFTALRGWRASRPMPYRSG